MIFESINISGVSEKAFVLIYENEIYEYLDIKFCKHKNKININKNNISGINYDFFKYFDNKLTNDKISLALKWVFEIDSSFQEKYLEGGILNLQIPLLSTSSSRSSAKNLSVNKYRELRPSVNLIIRPLFLKYPDNTDLYHYQKQGTRFLLKMRSAILADDMGLGKTIQTIFSIRVLIQMGLIRSGLVICPKTLIPNWIEEINKWAPELSPISFICNSKDRNLVWPIIYERFHIIILNYEQLRDPPNALIKSSIGVIVADEAHRIRKMSSQISKGIRNLKFERFWALTGTPIEKNVDDLITILSTIEPTRFSASYRKLNYSSLRSRYKEYILRRTKASVLKDLPKINYIHETIDLSEEQQKSYKHVVKNINKTDHKTEYILSLINKLKTICDYDPISFNSSKIDRIQEIIRCALLNNEKIVVFSYLLKPLYLLKDVLDKYINKNSSVILEGDMSLDERSKTINMFKYSKYLNVLLASSRVASEGINLTAANNVIFINQWWNPSSNKQAIDRVVRIGQKRPVFIYKFTLKNTIEENLQVILKNKEKTYFELVDKISNNETQYTLSKDDKLVIYDNILK